MISAAALTRNLVAINSANPATHPGGRGAGEARALCGQVLRAAGFDILPSTRAEGGCLVAYRPGRTTRPPVLLLGHLDTHGWWGPSTEQNGILTAPGAMDMKAGIAMVLAAVTRLAVAGHPRALLVVLTPDEESDSAALRDIVTDLRAEIAIVTEASGLQVGTRHAGAVTATFGSGITTRTLAALSRSTAARSGRPARYAHRGTAARVRVPVRPGERAADLAGVLRREAAVHGALLTHLDVRESLLAVGPVVQNVVDAFTAAAARRGRRVGPTSLSGWTEAAVLAAHGLPAVVFGPRGWGAHTRAERVLVADIDLGVDLLVEAVSTLPCR